MVLGSYLWVSLLTMMSEAAATQKEEMGTYEKLYRYCRMDLRYCYEYLVRMDAWDVILLIFMFFVLLFVLLRIWHFFTADSEIF